MNLATAIALAAELLRQSIAISQLIQQAQAEGRTELTAAERDAVVGRDDAARAALVSAIEAAKQA